MCKYCEEVVFKFPTGLKKFAPYGGASIVFDPEDVGFLLGVANGMTYSIEYCPWCGRKLELSEDTAILPLEERLKVTIKELCRTKDLLYATIDNLLLLLEFPDKAATRVKVLDTLREIRSEI